MTNFRLRIALSLAAAVNLIAAAPVIGTVTAAGAFRLNGDTVMANGTLTEGAVLESGRGNSSVRLTGGARLSLSADSRGKLYSDRIILEKGETRLENGVGFHLEALGLTIRPDRGISTGRIGLLGSNRVSVAALTGSFRVLNARGVLVANVAPGFALAFEPQASAAATHITGTLSQQNGHFLVTDQVTRVTMEVTGQRLASYVGQVVGVTGALSVAATSAATASQVIAASHVQTAAAVSDSVSVVGGVAAVATADQSAVASAFAAQGKGDPVGPPATPPGQPPGRPPVTPPGPPPAPPGRPPDRPPVSPPGLSR